MADERQNWNLEPRHVVESELDLDYELTGPDPIQACGTLHGRTFFFIAKHSNWSFEVADELGNLPSDTGNNACCKMEGRRKLADDMSLQDTQQIIAACARLFADVVRRHL